MPRPKKNRRIKCYPTAYYFKPRGIPMYELLENVLAEDEVEAIYWADYNGYDHETGAEKMEISRPTFGRILKSARRKIADAIINGKALRIKQDYFNKLKEE
ncbi:DUF134 domain-containing protein [Melioribacter sp. OK-6-Me]|uniref:DUF134 domain-containing protein n=1 Tax=unclassified Melioribacter TaxID=2627329 RepID=UPI003ED87723